MPQVVSKDPNHRTAICSQILLASCLVVIVLHLWGALRPSHENWGVHLFAFYPAWISAIALALGISILIPAIRAPIGRKTARLAQWSSGVPGPILLLAICGILVVLAALFPARINVLGDSDLILSLTSQKPGVEDVSANFRNQPLTYYAVRAIQYVLGGGAPVDVGYTYQILDDGAGLLFVSLLLLFLHFLELSPLEKLLIGGYIFFQTSLQFFFGYVENYALLNVSIVAFLVTGWLALEKKLHSIFAIISFAIMIGLHLGSVIFLPAPLILLYQIWRERRMQAILLGMAGIIGSALFFHLSNYSLAQFINRVEVGIQIDMLPFFRSYPGGPYPMFSSLHFIDWGNACLFLVSSGCFLVPVLAYFYARDLRRTSPLFVFLATATSCGFAFTFIFNAALGMARDWDLLTSFLIPVHFLVVYLFLRHFRSGRASHQVLIVLLILNALRVAAWIGINADADRHLQRAEVLTTPGLSGTFPIIYYEALGKVFWHRNEFDRSRIWYEHYMTIDSLNPRILANLAADYAKLGMNDLYFETLKRAARSENKQAALYVDLGNEYVLRGDTASAIRVLNRALELNPGSAEAHANLALLYFRQRNYALAAPHCSEAIAAGIHEPMMYRCAAYAYFGIGDGPRALEYFDTYLSLAPNDKSAQLARDEARHRFRGADGSQQ